MITIYTTKTCPKCKILKKKLTDRNIDYKEIQDIKLMRKLNILEVPKLEINDKLLDFSEANDWINGQ